VQTLDRLFRVIFARYRRECGHLSLESTWRRTSNKVTAYVASPLVVAVAVVGLGAYSLIRVGSPIEHRTLLQIVAGVSGVVVAVLLDRRFRKYLSIPPPLPSEEALSDTRFVFWCRAISMGTFVFAC